MNTDSYVYIGEKNTIEHYKSLIQKQMNNLYGRNIGLTPSNGLWERKAQKNLIKCCQIEWKCQGTPDGICGNGTLGKAPEILLNVSSRSVRLLKWAMTINGFYLGDFEENFSENSVNTLIQFQKFMMLAENDYGKCTKNVWASLLTGKGDTNRSVTALDTCSKITVDKAKTLVRAGYTDVGRYLINAEGGTLDKKLTAEELEIIKSNGLRVFPIFQTYGNKVAYFNLSQGHKDGIEANKAAQKLGFTHDCTIYFAVDYDVKTDDIYKKIIPYFEGVTEEMQGCYHIGAYGPRSVCNALTSKNLIDYSFVADMSSGFTGNMGQMMPSNWAYEQICEDKNLGIDKCVASSRATAKSIGTTTYSMASKKAKYITGLFETSNIEDPYGAIAPNFDGCGLSLGIFQWNIKSETLQELLNDMNRLYPAKMKEYLGESKYNEVIRMLGMSDSNDQLDWCNITNDDKKFKDGWDEALVKLAKSDEFKDIQDKYADKLLIQAIKKCNIDKNSDKLENEGKLSFVTERAFVFMLNITVNAGGINNSVCKVVRDKVTAKTSEVEKLKILTNAMFYAGSDAWKRCMFIIDGSELVHGIKYSDLSAKYSITDDVILS